jgi:amidase
MGSKTTRLAHHPENGHANPQQPPVYRGVAARKVAEREQRLAQYPEWRVPDPGSHVSNVAPLLHSRLTARERKIVNQDACALAGKIANHTFTSVEVLTAFCKAAVASQDLTNSLTEIFFDQGFARAKELDQHLERTGQVVGPLHGVPVSIKDHILVKGHDTSSGYASWAFKTVADRDAAVVKILRQAGAIIYVKTANPQTLLVCLD